MNNRILKQKQRWIQTPGALSRHEHKITHKQGCPARCWAVNARGPTYWWERRSLALTAKGACCVVDIWKRNSPPPDCNIWVRYRRRPQKGLLQSPICWGVVTDVWEISQMRVDSEDKDWSSVGLALEFQVILHPNWVLNPDNAVMISTLISFEDLHNINVCLRPGNMNGYAEATGQTLLLKMSNFLSSQLDPTRNFYHTPLLHLPAPRSQFHVAVVEAILFLNDKCRTTKIPQTKPLSPGEVLWYTAPSGIWICS